MEHLKKIAPWSFGKNIYNYNPSILGVPCIFFSGVYTLQHVFLHPSIFFIEKNQVNIWAIFRGWMVSDSHKATPILRSLACFLEIKQQYNIYITQIHPNDKFFKGLFQVLVGPLEALWPPKNKGSSTFIATNRYIYI